MMALKLRFRRGAALIAGVALTACGGGGTDAADPGGLTGPCLQEACFDGLQCISDVCVDPGAGTGAGPGDSTSDASDASNVDSTGGDSTGPALPPSATTTDGLPPDTRGDTGDTGGTTGPGTSDPTLGGSSSGDVSEESSGGTAAATESEGDGGSPTCDPMGSDSACVACVKTSCCPELDDCTMDGNASTGCFCVQACVAEGTDYTACLGGCGLAMPPPSSPVVPLGACVFAECGVCL